jgi:fructokinase
MTGNGFSMVGLGEVLWDLLPTGKQLGGAPANFAYHANLLGNRGVVVSRIGDDELGQEIRESLRQRELDLDGLQLDPQYPTGTVDVELDSLGQPSYIIVENVAWDQLEWDEGLAQIAVEADAVCFGTLAQRSPRTRETIRRFLSETPAETVRLFDVNLRQHYCTTAVLRASLEAANVVKLNEDELGRVARVLSLGINGDQVVARALLRNFHLDLVCVTRGANGSWLVSPDEIHEHPGNKVKVADTVGAGDAFTAALCHHYLKGSNLATMNAAANAMGAWVASCVGAMPAADPKVLVKVR